MLPFYRGCIAMHVSSARDRQYSCIVRIKHSFVTSSPRILSSSFFARLSLFLAYKHKCTLSLSCCVSSVAPEDPYTSLRQRSCRHVEPWLLLLPSLRCEV